MSALRTKRAFAMFRHSHYPLTMDEELSADVIWCLRALAQEANKQRELYPSFAVIADELVTDFDLAYSF